MNPLIQLERATSVIFVAFGLVCLTLSPIAQAVSPAPDGGYPGGNTAEGQNALLSLTSGGFNTAIGFLSLRSDTIGSFNTAIGAGALLANTADENTATGVGTLLSNTTGGQNTANGAFALATNTNGLDNTAVGVDAIRQNTTGNNNTATGAAALLSNTIGVNNTANGVFALANNTIGGDNTAIGDSALSSNTTGGNNTANGYQALLNNTTGIANAATGAGALMLNTTGSANTALGAGAGSLVTTASNVICIGIEGANVTNSCFINNIRGVTTQNADAIPVLIDSAGQLGTANSARRFKKGIKPMDKTSESILALKPVTFHYKSDTKDTPQFGLIAEDVAAVNPDLVVRDKNGEIYTVRYDAVNAMLLNEFLKEHSTVQELKKEIVTLTATVKEQAAQIQKVSAQLEASKPAPQMVNNPQAAAFHNQPSRFTV